jgi:quinoprotein glucose dehydrogenase
MLSMGTLTVRPARFISERLGLLLAGILASTAPAGTAQRDWPVYLGDKESSHFSSLHQINRKNVGHLRIAWTYHSSTAAGNRFSQIQCNPLIIDGVLYGTSPELSLFALDAATGKELWRFVPPGSERGGLGVNRGLAYWAAGEDRRILLVAGAYLYAIEANRGKVISSFGTNGRVDLKQDLGRDASRLYLVGTTPGIVFKNLLILGARVGEGPGPVAPGHIRAYDIRSGKLAWIFHTIPWPGEAGYETWPPDAWQYIGSANCWTGMALDETRGIVYIPTGSPAYDFWGGNRVGQNLFANCLLALDASTGKRVWHYQLVHHDLWDRDLPAPPNLVTLRRGGRKVDAVAQVTKSAQIFVFDRENGQPLFPIAECPAPASDLQGESAWPTQPLPTRPDPFARQLFTANEITDLSPEAHRAVLEQFMKLRPHAPFSPPSREGTIIFPGFDGGAEWGGAAIDPAKGILYVNSSEAPWILTMVEQHSGTGTGLSGGAAIYSQICAACHGVDRAGNAARSFPSLQKIGDKLKKTDIATLLNTGKGMMPSFAFLTGAQREAVAGFLLGESRSLPSRSRGVDAANEGDAQIREPYSMTGYNRWVDPNGYPANKPPWGTLNAIDLNTGCYLWRIPLGEYPELTAKGIPLTGTENYGGPIVTAGGLVFIAATRDEVFRAFDQKTGRLLWSTKLPAAGYATPATYLAGRRQFIVIACGGGKLGTKSGDAYVAFALPE